MDVLVVGAAVGESVNEPVERAFPNALIEVSAIGFGGVATMGVLSVLY
jgi:hypothetical protein